MILSKPLACGIKKLNSFVILFGLIQFKSNSSLYIYKHDGIIAYLLVYTDDMILIGGDTIFLQKFVRALVCKFLLKNLGDL